MIRTNVTMTLEHFHDFYYLEAIMANIAMNISAKPELAFSRAVENLKRDTEEAIEEIVPNIAFRTFVYLYAACIGEARHARESNAESRYIPQIRAMHRKDCYASVDKFPPDKENLSVLCEIYNGQKWVAAFGGKAWGNIAQALKMYFTVSPATFIDYVIDLEHNGGTAFNKSDAHKTIRFYTRYPGHLNHFLDWKFAHNILEREPQFTEEISLTRRVYNLVKRYSVIFRKPEPTWLRPYLNRLDAYEVEWGNERLDIEEKWTEWADVTASNEPSAEMLFNLTKLNEESPFSYTEKKLLAMVKKQVNATVKKHKKYMTKELRQGFDKYVENWVKWALPKTRAEKNRVRYEVLPCKVSLQPGKQEFQVAVPYEKHGESTEYGFKIQTDISTLPVLTGDTQGFDGKPGFLDGFLTKTYSGLALHVKSYQFLVHNNNLEAYIS